MSDQTDTGRLSNELTQTLLKGRYAIEREIGRGGIGVVYLARDTQLHSKPVVVKLLLETITSSEHRLWTQKKFRQEIEALARIDHPGVIGVLDAGELPDGKPYFVMQFVEGVTLRSLLNADATRQMDFARVAAIARQIGHALGAAHDKGVHHRDLKPENIMLQNWGAGEELVKLIDFGIAAVKDSQVAVGGEPTKVAGTPAYMAPEQLRGQATAASDIYAFGVIAHEMITGRRPFRAESAVELYELQLAGVSVKPCLLRPDLNEGAQEAILKALSFDPADRHLYARDLGEELARTLRTTEPSPQPPAVAAKSTTETKTASFLQRQTTRVVESDGSTGTRIALLYKRNAQPDDQLLKLLETQLRIRGYRVFVDRHLTVGVEWAQEIERQVRMSDIVIPLLSAASVTSEMLAYEIEIAHDAAQRQNGKPRLLPVRVSYDAPLPETLAKIIHPIQHALWNSPQDDERLIEELVRAITGGAASPPAAAPRRLEPVGGAVPLDSEFYIVRPADDEFQAAINRQDSIVLVKGARQMGKTSLLARGLQQARTRGAHIVLTDLQTFNAPHLQLIEAFFQTMIEIIIEQLDLDVDLDEVWNARHGASMNFGRFMRREVLSKLTAPLVWGLDEVDRLFACDFGSEVFGLFRSWHNARSLDPAGPWQRLTLAIAYATEAHLFITDINQSPFNVGTRLSLEDFTVDQVEELNRRYGAPLRDEAETARFCRLLSGHPYLVRRGLYELAAHRIDLATFERQAHRDEGPFGDHLRRVLVLLAQDATLADVVRAVLRGEACSSAESFYRLRSAGVMAGESAREIRPRCLLYESYLKRHLLF